MELVPRDLQIMETIGQLGTADTEILRRLHFPNDSTGRACQQRLRKLSDAELLKRVRLIVADGETPTGSLPMLYFLTEAGADLVERETGVRPPRITRSDPKPFTLRHRIETVRARLAIDEAASFAGISRLIWIMEQDTRGGDKPKKGYSPSEFLVLLNRYHAGGHAASFRPDAACHIRLPHNDQFASLLAYFEVDRSTEGHLQWQRKLQGVEAFVADPKGWRRHWPDVAEPIIRIFALCKSQRRVGELIATSKSSPAAPYMRFATFPLDPQTALTGEVWQSCDGEVRRILRGSNAT